MMRVILAATSLALLAACGGPADGTYEVEDGTITVDSDASGGETEIRFTDNEGNEAVVTSGTDSDVDLPNGFSIYPGAEVQSSTVMSGDQGEGAMVMMSSSDSPKEMVTFYRSQAEAAGVTIEIEMTANDTMMIGGEGPDGLNFNFNATPAGGETNGTLIVGNQ